MAVVPEDAPGSAVMVRVNAQKQILFLVDQHFRMTEVDGAIYDTENLFSVTMKGDKLQGFLSTWDTVPAGLRTDPGDAAQAKAT